ncbi:MAG: universal stress protein [Hyphomicrobiales bacterium]|nr:universal stress protein [Hyphomicrobiales bacterium]MDE2284127.1 universal stress protein [Hyphomicrobiales bacterium]
MSGIVDTVRPAQKKVRFPIASSIASIMVHVNFDPSSDGRVRVAADLARRFDAVLIGVAGWVPGRETGGWFANELAGTEERCEQIAAELASLGERFRKVAEGSVAKLEWKGRMRLPREVIPAEARSADIIVMGPHAAAGDIIHAFDPGTVLLAAGRPALIVPDSMIGFAGSRALIAWKDTTEARRALQGALPLLQFASHVALVEIAEDVLENTAYQHLDDIEKYLGWHGINVNVKSVLPPEKSIPDQLKATAAAGGADLIVAGAYGHTRLGEWIFGGVTRDFLRGCETCCFLSN